MSASEFFLQRRVTGTPNNGGVAQFFHTDDKALVGADYFVSSSELENQVDILERRVSASPNNGLVSFFVGLVEAGTEVNMLRGDAFGNCVSDQKKRGGL